MKQSTPAQRATHHSARGWTLGGLAALAVIALAFVGCTLTSAAAPSAGWNVVLITLDTTRVDRLGCYGYGRADTPTIDALCREGVQYLRCYSPAPVTLPSHTTLLTGLNPPRHGIHTNGPDALSAEAETLAEVLHRKGYATAAVMGSFVLDHQFGLNQGFDSYDDDMSQAGATSRFQYPERNAELVTDAALAWWKQPRDQPAFLWVHYFDPHAPYAAPGFDASFATVTDYDAEIHYVDSQLKRLIEAIDATNDRPTLIILTADHGEALYEHGEPTHGLFVYNTTLHVPLVVRFPDRRAAGQQIDSPVGLVDVMPSVLGWLDVVCPNALDGVPLPLSAPTADSASGERPPIFFENRYVVKNYGWSPLQGVIHGDLKFIEAPRPELYNLRDDPHELTNRFDASHVDSQRMRKWLEEVVARQAEQTPLQGERVEMTDAARAKLEALGYVGGSEASDDFESADHVDAKDPKDMLGIFQQIQNATSLIEHGKPDKATSVLIEIITSTDPSNYRAMRLLSSLIGEEGEEGEVRERVMACLLDLVRRPSDAMMPSDVPSRLGVALIEEERYEEAIEAFDRLLAMNSKHAAAQRYLGQAYQALGKQQPAIAAYESAIALVDSLDEPPLWLGEVREQLALLRREKPDATSSKEQ